MRQIYMLSATFFLLFSCNKHHDRPGHSGGTPDPTPTGNLRLKSSAGFIYAYDDQGRLIKSTYANSLPAHIEYTYTDKMVTISDVGTNGNSSNRIFYTLNSDGLAISDKYILPAGGTPIITTYTYNAAQQLTEEIAGEEGKAPVSRSVHYYSKGNQDSIKMFSLTDGKLLSNIRFDYYTDRPNVLSAQNNGIFYQGASNANLLKGYFQIELGDTISLQMTYEFDANNRPSKSHVIQNGSALSDVIYTYF